MPRIPADLYPGLHATEPRQPELHARNFDAAASAMAPKTRFQQQTHPNRVTRWDRSYDTRSPEPEWRFDLLASHGLNSNRHSHLAQSTANAPSDASDRLNEKITTQNRLDFDFYINHFLPNIRFY